MHDFLPEFGRILATSKAKYLKKNSEIFSKKNIRFWPGNRPKSAENAARKSPPGFRALQFGLRAGSGCPKIVRAGGPSPKTGTSLTSLETCKNAVHCDF